MKAVALITARLVGSAVAAFAFLAALRSTGLVTLSELALKPGIILARWAEGVLPQAWLQGDGNPDNPPWSFVVLAITPWWIVIFALWQYAAMRRRNA